MRVIIAVLLLCATGFAQETVTLTWDAHPEAATITGFRLYQTKNAGTYTTSPAAIIVPGTQTTTQIPKPGLGRYCWVLTAYLDEEGMLAAESAYSNEVCTVLKPKPPHLVTAVLSAAIKAPLRAVQWAFGGKKTLRIGGAK